jgi:hypothetical protein
MIEVRVLDIRPHPDQATNNPDCWAVKLWVSYDGRSCTFWRWLTTLTTRELESKSAPDGGLYIGPSNAKKPSASEIIARFWDDTFAELHGFSFNKDDP